MTFTWNAPSVFARYVRDVPIGRKLMGITMVTAAAALLLAGAGIIISDSILFRSSLERDLTALAQITADNSTAALAFEDPRAASEVLHALRARPHLVVACIYRNNGTVLARYVRPGSGEQCPASNTRDEIRFSHDELMLSRPVLLEGRRVGALTLRYDLGEIGERVRLYGMTVFLVLLASSLIAFLLSSRLRAIIATPVAQLVRATKAVSTTGDYGIRAAKLSGDELGVLVDAFNGMLARIQTRDLELMDALFERERALEESRDARDQLTRLNADLAQSNEKLARSNEDLERFAFVASHDLQEPLRMITLYSQLLVRTYQAPLSDDAAGYVRNIVASAKRMRNLLSDLLAYTDIGAPAAGVAQPVDLNRTLGQVLENLRAAIEEAAAVVTADRLPAVRAHEGHFVSLFQNLISNALKYRSDRTPEIHVSFERSDGWLRFAVSDNGIGIAPEYHAKIFVAFKRLHGQNIAGTGIGLAICQRVVDRYRGRIWVESRAGEGAKFIFALPEELMAQEYTEK
ncbi:MAG TPA: ATP-binding protein [Bryobacteraceae bacterium]|nr:ATP-binding protein [Bryobacteraceae bacterium]